MQFTIKAIKTCAITCNYMQPPPRDLGGEFQASTVFHQVKGFIADINKTMTLSG